MAKSRVYDSLSELPGNSYVFEFKDDKLIGIYKNGSILDPSLEEWTTAKDSSQALSASNIFKYGVA